MKKIIWLILLFTVTNAVGQSNLINTQYITIKNDSLTKYVNEIVKNEIDGDRDYQFFKRGIGYIMVSMRDYVRGDTVVKLTIESGFADFKEDVSDTAYPAYYTLISGRPVLLYVRSLENLGINKYSYRSKKRFRQWLEPYLEKVQDRQFYNEDGSKAFRIKKFRIDYFKFGGEKDLKKKENTYD